jgi:hypothetical protein
MGVFDIVMEKPASITPIASTDFNRFSNDSITHTHRLDWLQQVFLWLCQAHTSSTDFSRFFHHYIKHILRFDWLQQVFSWLYQTHPSPRLTSAGFSMTISNTPIASTDFSRFFHDYIKHTYRFDWLQQVFPWKNLLKSVKTMGVFDIVMEKPAEVSRGDGCVWYSHGKTCWSQSRRLTSADFSMTISNTPIASTDFSRFILH